jgi:hypothetical protein
MTGEDYQPPVPDGDRIKAGLAVHQVAVTTGVRPDQIIGRSRLTGPACRARRFAIYLSHVAFGWPLERAANAFGVNRATAGAACRWTEDERDRPDVDQMLERCEDAIRTLFSAPRCDLALPSGPGR